MQWDVLSDRADGGTRHYSSRGDFDHARETHREATDRDDDGTRHR